MGPDPWRPIAWVSTDADHWSLVEMADAPSDVATFAVGVTATADGFVAVGRSGRRPVAWTSPDGAAWTRHDVPVLGGTDDWERMVVVADGPGGLVAGGSVGPELFERHTRFWRSTDGGMTWSTVAEQPGFEGAEPTALLPLEDGWLGLGRIGTGQRTSGSFAWRSHDASTWARIDDPALATGWARNVVRGPDGALVAVGSDTDELAAYAWRSADDGATWAQAPETPVLTHFGEKIRMTDVVALPDELLAVGNYVGVQYGTGTSWLSPDGLSWTRASDQAAFGQSEPLALVTDGSRSVAVGDFGAPDDYIPRVWLTPPG